MQTPGGRFLPLLLAALAAAAALKLATLGLARLDCAWLASLLVAMAWPLWAYTREQLMFVRRLLLAGATTEAGHMAMMAIDEALFRQSLHAELVEELQGQRQPLREALRSQLEQTAADYRAQAAQRVDKVFVPATDG